MPMRFAPAVHTTAIRAVVGATTVTIVGAAILLLIACSSGKTPGPTPAGKNMTPAPVRVTSPAFADGQPIPVEFTCDGQDQSPPLQWQGVPADAQSIAILVDDPDAPAGAFTHWIVYDLPSASTALPQNQPKRDRLDSGALQGKNGRGRVGYAGPCPPRGPAHRYQFNVYALSQSLGLEAGATTEQVEQAMQGRVLGEGRLTGTYQRK